MTDLITQLEVYCQELVGAPVALVADPEASGRLPVFLGQAYEPLKGEIFDHQWVFLCRKGRSNPTPAEAASHAELATKALGADVVLVFWALASFDRRRLVQRRIPFILPGHQVFLPGKYINLKESGGGTAADALAEHLSMPSQVMLLFHLLRRADQTRMPLHEWAKALGYSRMTLSRAAEELVRADLAEKTAQGKAVFLGFGSDRRQLWDRAVPRLDSPVGKLVNVTVRDQNLPDALGAGMTALASYSDMAPARQRVMAMDGSALITAKRNRLVEAVPYADADTTIIEAWRYAPVLLSEDGRTVDRLSLYLSLRNSKDERVEAALKQVLEGVPW